MRLLRVRLAKRARAATVVSVTVTGVALILTLHVLVGPMLHQRGVRFAKIAQDHELKSEISA